MKKATIMIVFILLPQVVSAACLSNDQIIFLGSLEEQLNITGHKLIDAFDAVCYQNYTQDMSVYASKEMVENRISVALAIISNENIEQRVDNHMQNYTLWFEKEIGIYKLLDLIYNQTVMKQDTNITAYASKDDLAQVRNDLLTLQDRMNTAQLDQLQPAQAGFDPVWIIAAIAAVVLFVFIVVRSRPRIPIVSNIMRQQTEAPQPSTIDESRMRAVEDYIAKKAKHEK